MTVREVLRLGHPHLRRRAKPYPPGQVGSAVFRELVQDLRDTLHAQGGIGLAAPQIDVDARVVIIEIAGGKTRYGDLGATPFRVYVNPTIQVMGDGVAGYWEGCLSVPGLRGYVERPQHLLVDYLDGEGQSAQLRADGFLATVFQHEFDHLDGVLYVDRMKDRARFAFDEEYLRFHQDPASGGGRDEPG